MSGRDFIRGVPAAGHLTASGGFWHPGPADTCRKPACDPQHLAMLRAKPVRRAKCVPDCNWLQTRQHEKGCKS